jgi:hypothetical protein
LATTERTDKCKQSQEEVAFNEKRRLRMMELQEEEEALDTTIRKIEEEEQLKSKKVDDRSRPDALKSNPEKMPATSDHRNEAYITVLSGKLGFKGFIDGVLVNEAQFANPSAIVIMNSTEDIIVCDTGYFCMIV